MAIEDVRIFLADKGILYLAVRHFRPSKKDIAHKACCWCCESNLHFQVLTPTFEIKQLGFQDLGLEDVPLVQSHDTFHNGQHPYPDYKQLIDNDPHHKYYLFLQELLLEKDKWFKKKFEKLEHETEYNQMYFVIKYLEDLKGPIPNQ